MSYVDGSLLDGERVVYRGALHWIVFVSAALWWLFALLLFLAAGDSAAESVEWLAMLVSVVALWRLLVAVVVWWSTELAVTDRRVIVKVGLIRRSTVELNHAKVESYAVDQSVVGRLLGFGTLTVHGTGGGVSPVACVSRPLEFRRQAVAVADRLSG